MGKPLKRTPERVEAILAAVRLGQPLMRAARAAGIGYQTFRDWRKESPAFAEQLEDALADGERYVLGKLHIAIEEGNVAALFGWLERRFPDDWSRGERRQTEVSGTINVRQFVRQNQAILDDILPHDPDVRRQYAERAMELDVEDEQ